MIVAFQAWWQRIKKPLEIMLVPTSILALLALIIVIIVGYHWGWTGLGQKTLWDWLQLLIIPAVLAIGGYLFNFTTSRNEQEATKQRDQYARKVNQER